MSTDTARAWCSSRRMCSPHLVTGGEQQVAASQRSSARLSIASAVATAGGNIAATLRRSSTVTSTSNCPPARNSSSGPRVRFSLFGPRRSACSAVEEDEEAPAAPPDPADLDVDKLRAKAASELWRTRTMASFAGRGWMGSDVVKF